ncbi:hypothetical protein BJ170DRAFT_617655 [Xylariales sp. AK1849]|nr:hypothetical protein BJ170DRAFT_617655 [Xylariales sp. AK1849]
MPSSPLSVPILSTTFPEQHLKSLVQQAKSYRTVKMSAAIKTIAIVGATGNQGSSVAKTFLSTPNWHVRALTRSPSSEKAQVLKTLGAELVQADLSDSASLSQAFVGVHAIFVNTDFWQVYRHTKDSQLAYGTEVKHGKSAVDAASKVKTLERFVYSALGPMSKASGGKYTHSFHWESKAAVVDYIESEYAETLAKKASLIYLGAYVTNAFLQPKIDPRSGEYTIVLPGPETTRIPIVDPTASTGPFVRELILHEEPGTKLLAYDTDSYLKVAEIIAAWSKVTGKKAKFSEMRLQAMHELTGVPLEVLDGAAFLGEFDYMTGVEGVIEPGQLKNMVDTPCYEELLRSKDMGDLLSSDFPKM